MITRIVAATRSRAAGAMVAQLWQAFGSFGIQVFAAWMLGAAGLGLISVCLGVIIMSTAITSGVVGDSLILLDRHDPRVRGGLQFWALVALAASTIGSGVVFSLLGLLTPVEALIFAAALGAFQVEELVRRLFMATTRFWHLVVIDTAAVVVTLGFIGIGSLITQIGVGVFLAGLLAGQLVGIVVGVIMLPASERRLVPLRDAAVAKVLRYGAVRGALMAASPLILTLVRLLVTVSLGAVALGNLEGARIYVAPALLLAQGLGSYLLSANVRDRGVELSEAVRRASRVSLGVMAAAAAGGAILTVAAPMMAPFVTGPNVFVDRLAVAAWALYVVGWASCQPFGSLASARDRQLGVLVCRGVDALVAVSLVAVLLLAGLPAWTAPVAMALGVALAGLLVRHFVLKPPAFRPADRPTPLRTSHAAN